MYSCLTDTSKAVDKVQCGQLFKLLIDSRMLGLIIRLLLDRYTRQQLCHLYPSILMFQIE